MEFKFLLRASAKLFIHVLDRVVISKREAIVLVCLYHLQQIAIFISQDQNWPERDNNTPFKFVQNVSKVFNFKYVMEWIGFPINSIVWIFIFTVFAVLHFIGFAWLLYVKSSDNEEFKSRRIKFLYRNFKFFTKYSTFALTVPILQICLLNLAGPNANILLGAISLVLFSLYFFPEKFFFEENNFTEMNYLCKTMSNQKIFDTLAMVIVIATESFQNSDFSRLIVSILMVIFFAYKLWSSLSWDYFYINLIQKIHSAFIGVKLALWVFLCVSSILRMAGTEGIPNAPFVIAILVGFKLAVNLQQRVHTRTIGCLERIKSAQQAERYINLLINQSKLYKALEKETFYYSDEEVYSKIEPIYHFGTVSHDYFNNYGKFESIWMSRRLYDPLNFKAYEARPLDEEEIILKTTPKSVILFKHYIKDLFIHFIKRFPKSVSLRLNFAYYVLHYLRHTHLVILECFQLNKLLQNTHATLKIETSRLRILNTVNNLQKTLDLIRKEDENYMNLDIIKVSDFEQKYIAFAAKINTFLKKDFEFFELLSQEHVYLDVIYRNGQVLTSLLADVSKDFKLYLCGSPLATQMYAEFQSMVMMDEIEALELAKQLDVQISKIENYARLEKDFYEIELMFNKATSIIQIGGHFENLGKIHYVNEGSMKLFGYQARELELVNVNVLMPRLLRYYHDSFLTAYFETGRETILYREQRSFGRNKEGYIFPVSLLVKPMVNLETSQFMFISYLKELQTSNEYIITDQNGCIDGISKKLSEALGITPEILDVNLVQMQLLCPMLSQLFNLKPNDKKLNRMLTSSRKTLRDSGMSVDDHSSKGDVFDSAEFRRVIESREEIEFQFLLRSNPQEYCIRLGELLPKNVVELNASLLQHKRFGASSKLEHEFVGQLTNALRTIKTIPNEKMVEVTGFISEYASSTGSLKWYIFRFVSLENLNKSVNKGTTRRATHKMRTHKITKFIKGAAANRIPPNQHHCNPSSFAIQGRRENAATEEKGNRLEEFFKEMNVTETDENMNKKLASDPEEDVSSDSDSESVHADWREENLNSMKQSINPKMMSTILENLNNKSIHSSAMMKLVRDSANDTNRNLKPMNQNSQRSMESEVSFDTQFYSSDLQHEVLRKVGAVDATGENVCSTHNKIIKDSAKFQTYQHGDHSTKQVTNFSDDQIPPEDQEKKFTVNFQNDSSQGSASSKLSKGIRGLFGNIALALDPLNNKTQLKKIQASISSTGSSSKYTFRVVRNAIKHEYIPTMYYQAKWIVITVFVVFWISFIAIALTQLSGFRNLNQIPSALNVANQIAYEIHKIGTLGYDLSLVQQFDPQGQRPQIISTELADILEEDRINLSSEILDFLNNRSVYVNYYRDVDSILDQEIAVDNLTVHLHEFFFIFLVEAHELIENCLELIQNNSISQISSESVEGLVSAYESLNSPINKWTAFFTSPASLNYSDLRATIVEVTVLSCCILVLAVISIHRNMKATRIIDNTVYQVTHLSQPELMSMKDQIIRARHLFNGRDGDKEFISGVHHQEKKQRQEFKSGKKKIHRMRVSPVKRAVPTLLLAIVCIGFLVFVLAISSPFFNWLAHSLLNALFFATEDVSTQNYIAIYKNYSSNALINGYANANPAEIRQYFSEQTDHISSRYKQALSTVEEAAFSSDTEEKFHNIMFVNTCNYTEFESICPQLLYGIFKEGLLTAKLGTVDYMVKQIEVELNATERWQTFQEVLNAGKIIHEMLSIMMNLTIEQISESLSLVQMVFMLLAIAVPIFSLLLFYWYWKKCIRQLKMEFISARRILEIIPVPYIIGNSRLKNFVTTTAEVILK